MTNDLNANFRNKFQSVSHISARINHSSISMQFKLIVQWKHFKVDDLQHGKRRLQDMSREY